MKARAPRGTQDLLPNDLKHFKLIEDIAARLFPIYGFKEIRTPIFEEISLYARTTGETSDIVEKQMFTIENEYALRPEFTPSIVRALIENNLFQTDDLFKLYSIGPLFRKERPQKGRFRQFHQVNLETIGSASPLAEVELITLIDVFFREIGVTKFQLKVNSIGCINCKQAFMKKLSEACSDKLELLCENCKKRFDRNPFRILDCKNEQCKETSKSLPKSIDNLCSQCKEHFDQVTTKLGINFNVDPYLVRGLDYYTRTVFEFQSEALGAQDALGGGGRYDNVVKELGGPDSPAVGFACGVERLLIAINKKEYVKEEISVAVIWISANEKAKAFEMLMTLRNNKIASVMEFEYKSLKSQMRSANKLGAKYVLIIGEDEVKKDVVTLKRMSDGMQKTLPLDQAIAEVKL